MKFLWTLQFPFPAGSFSAKALSDGRCNCRNVLWRGDPSNGVNYFKGKTNFATMMHFPNFLNYNCVKFFFSFFFNECIESFHIAGIGVESLSKDGHFLADTLPPVGIDEETVWCAGAAVSAGCFFANDMCRFLTLFKQTQWPKTPKLSLSIEYQRCLLVPGEESLD